MNYSDLVKSTILELDDEIYEELIKTLVGEYLHFSILRESDVTKEILSEKMCDYFEKLELKTKKSFEKHLETYIYNLSLLVENKIEKPGRQKKDSPPIPKSRALKYYEKAIEIRNMRNITTSQLVDYTRIIMCIYISIIENHFKEINDFNYSLSCLDIDKITNAMKKKQKAFLKKPLFEIKDLYCSDTFTFILVIIILHFILNNKVEGEYYHG